MNFNPNLTVLIFFGGSCALALLLALVLLIGKRNKPTPKGKKVGATILLLLASISFIMTPLVAHNFIPLTLHLGYFLEVKEYDNNGKTGFIKFTMGNEVHYHEQYLNNDVHSGKNTFKDRFVIDGNHVTIYRTKTQVFGEFEIGDFGKGLYQNGVLIFQYFQDI